MRRTLQINLQTTISILCVLSWLSCAGVQGLPAASRTASGESISARRRGGDDLIAGSDFLNMFIGAKVDPTVRSRRFPLVSGDVAEPRQGHTEEGTASRQLRPSEGQDVDAHSHRRANIINPHEKLSGLIKSQDRQNYGLETHDSHNSNKVDHSEDLQRRGSTKFKYVHSIDSLEDHLDAATEDSTVDDASASEDRVFGDRTHSRSSSNTPSSVTTSVPTSVAVDVTDHYSTVTSEDSHRSSTVIDVLNSPEKIDVSESHTNTNEANVDVTEKVSISPKFSVSSSIKKSISKEDKTLNSEISQHHQSNNEDKFTSPNNIDDNEVGKDLVSPTSTESTSFTTEEESTTTTAVTESDSAAELNENGSTNSEDITAEPTVTANVEEIPDGAEFQKIGVPQDRQETAVKVVSVRVSSSVAQVAPSSEETDKKTPVGQLNTVSEQPSKHSRSESFSLESEDHPPVTAIQRSELLVEESSPSEVTAIPFASYTSFLSSKFQAASTNLYQTPQQTSPNPHEGAVNYQSSLTPASARRLQFFNHPPRHYRNPNIEALRRSSEDSLLLNSYVKANIRDGGSRRYASHSLPRGQDTEYQTLRHEPASVAESIQRSIITRQDADRSEARTRSQFHQDKNAFADGRYQGEEIGDRKRYSQPERVWGEPEKVYGEPEKVYGEPEKVYGEPERVYGEPEKVYGEPEKVYGEPEKVYGEPEKVYGEPEKNYEVDEAVSVLTNGRAHGVQPTQGSTPGDSAIKMIDSKVQDPNHKFGYVVEGRNFRKYRVEERTSDGFIVGEYGVVSHDDGSLRGVRYTADESINPRLIYDTLVKFLSL